MKPLLKRMLSLTVTVAAGASLATGGYWLIGLAYHRGWSLFDCFYMTAITLTTTGFGETLSGMEGMPVARLWTVGVMFFGAGILVYFLSTLTAFVVEGHLSQVIRRQKMLREIAKLRNHVIVCGADETARHIIAELLKTQRNFVVIEPDRANIEKSFSLGEFFFVEGDPTDDGKLEQAGIRAARGIIAATPSDKDNLYIAFTSRQVNPGIRIICRVVDPASAPKLMRAGADKVVSPNFIGGLRMVSEMIRPAVVTFLDAMLRDPDNPYRVEETTLREGSELVGKSLKEADLSARTGALVMAMRDPGAAGFVYCPTPDRPLQVGTVLVVLADTNQLKMVRDLAGETEVVLRPSSARPPSV